MGLIFDYLGTKSDEEQLQKLLVRNVRMLAQLAVCPATRDKDIAVSDFRRLRSQINDNFAGLESQMDTARFEFEFRHRREKGVTGYEQMQRVQPALRSIYLLELTLFSHRGPRETDSGFTFDQNQALGHFQGEYKDQLMHIAAWFADEEDSPAHITYDSIQLLQQPFEDRSSPSSQAIIDICQKMLSALLPLQNGSN